MSEWIDWQGGECPVARDALVDVHFRCGGIQTSKPAWAWTWDHTDDPGDIVAYRGPSTQLAAAAFDEDVEIAKLRTELAKALELLANEHALRVDVVSPFPCPEPDCSYSRASKTCDCHAEATRAHDAAVRAAIKGESQ